jgi:P4 family phage/plasmid primase-like protien
MAQKVIKTEVFSASALAALLKCDGVAEDVKNLLRVYKKRAVDGNKVVVEYDFVEPGCGIGRRYTQQAQGCSLQGFPRDIRAALCQEHYIDVDIVCCHHSILLSLARHNGWPCDALAAYVEQRDDKLKEIMAAFRLSEKAVAKNLYTILLFGGGVKTWMDMECINADVTLDTIPDFLNKYIEDLTALRHLVYHDPQFAEFREFVERRQQDKVARRYDYSLYNQLALKCKDEWKQSPEGLARSTLGIVLQTFEARYMDLVDEALTARGRPMEVLVFDGGHIRKLSAEEQEVDPALLEEVALYANEGTGMQLKLAQKPFTHSLDLTTTTRPRKQAKRTPLPTRTPPRAATPTPAVAPGVEETNLVRLFRRTEDESERYLADFAKEVLGPVFAYSANQWYEFVNHRWRAMGEGKKLHLAITDVVLPAYMRVFNDLYSNKPKDGGVFMKRSLSFLRSNYIGRIVGVLECLYEDLEFESKLDEAPHLVCFKNGVYNTDTHEFRDGRPEDMVSRQIDYDFVTTVDPEAREYVDSFIRSLFRTPDMAEYVLNTLAYIFSAQKKLQQIFLWTGCGGNGKGVLKNMLAEVLGPYYTEPDVSLYTTKKQSSSGANPEEAKLKGCLLSMSTEPGAEDKLKVDKIKRMTGGDKIQARFLYQREFWEFTPKCMFVIQMNSLPSLSAMDGGVVRRFKIVNFPYKFVQNPVTSNQKMIDLNVEQKYKANVRYRQQFALMLLQRLKDLQGHGMIFPEPEDVSEATRQYFEANNSVSQFLAERVEIMPDNWQFLVTAGELRQNYMDWCKAEGIEAVPNKNRFADAMKMNGFESIKCTTRGPYHNRMVYVGFFWK